ncbi:MAG: hypothetical protein J07HX64_01365 [halophilic archaeon J07HX64]|jgi:Uncharacterized membrane-associated protein/domain|nr:MAG: hypothetical protein J07HX64_01365 [halophilic archaeon J07HX64]
MLVGPPPVGGDTHSNGLEDGQTVFLIELDTDGDAHWQITERIPIADDEAEVAFTGLAEEFESGGFDPASTDAAQAAADAVDRSTGRQMSVTDRERTSTIERNGENRTGLLTTSFTWENFTRVGDEGELYLDDVFGTEGELWLPGLTPDQELVVVAPDGYAVLDASVPPEDGELRWEGPAEFDLETLTATFAGDASDESPDDATGVPDDTGTSDDSGGSDTGLLWPVVAGTSVAIAVAAAVLIFYRGRRGNESDEGSPDVDDGAGTGSGTATTESATDGGGAETETDTAITRTEASGDDPTGTVDTDAPETTTDSGGSGVDETLLSDEERVERLLERNGGRMKQTDIVDETGWSNAKVSQLLSSMAEEDQIDKLRIGRENLISFPDVDVAEFDDDP